MGRKYKYLEHEIVFLLLFILKSRQINGKYGFWLCTNSSFMGINRILLSFHHRHISFVMQKYDNLLVKLDYYPRYLNRYTAYV